MLFMAFTCVDAAPCRTPATRTPDGYLSPHLFSAAPRAALGFASAAPGAAPPLPLTAARRLSQTPGHAAPRTHGTPAAGGGGGGEATPGLSPPLAAGMGLGGGARGPASTPGLLGGGGGGRRGSRSVLSGTAAAARPLSGGPWDECWVMVLLHEQQLPAGG